LSHPHPELTLPPPLAPGALRIIALGGLGEIGRNMTVLETGGRLLVIDCGVLFPEDHHPGVDLILPDFSYLDGRLDDIEAVVLTHGHEDHIGAVPFLLARKRDIPLIGSQLTLALVEAKLKEHRIKPYTLTVKEGQREKLGAFDLEFVAVNHSIPDALAVMVRTAAGSLLHTGDFKMDQLPLDGRITDLRAFARLGEEGVDLFLTDSTNADVPGFTAPERDISSAIDKVFRHAQRRIIVACFSSHVHRVQQVLDAADKAGRKVALVGRSMVRNMTIAADWATSTCPGGPHRPQAGRRPARRPDRAGEHRQPGRADGGPGEDGQPRPPDRRRAGRHRAAGQFTHPRQRERRLSGDQRAHALGCPRRAQGQRQGPRVRSRRSGRAHLLLQHRSAAQRPSRPRGVAAHVRQR
jgi:ribonuclease J